MINRYKHNHLCDLANQSVNRMNHLCDLTNQSNDTKYNARKTTDEVGCLNTLMNSLNEVISVHFARKLTNA